MIIDDFNEFAKSDSLSRNVKFNIKKEQIVLPTYDFDSFSNINGDTSPPMNSSRGSDLKSPNFYSTAPIDNAMDSPVMHFERSPKMLETPNIRSQSQASTPKFVISSPTKVNNSLPYNTDIIIQPSSFASITASIEQIIHKSADVPNESELDLKFKRRASLPTVVEQHQSDPPPSLKLSSRFQTPPIQKVIQKPREPILQTVKLQGNFQQSSNLESLRPQSTNSGSTIVISDRLAQLPRHKSSFLPLSDSLNSSSICKPPFTRSLDVSKFPNDASEAFLTKSESKSSVIINPILFKLQQPVETSSHITHNSNQAGTHEADCSTPNFIAPVTAQVSQIESSQEHLTHSTAQLKNMNHFFSNAVNLKSNYTQGHSQHDSKIAHVDISNNTNISVAPNTLTASSSIEQGIEHKMIEDTEIDAVEDAIEESGRGLKAFNTFSFENSLKHKGDDSIIAQDYESGLFDADQSSKDGNDASDESDDEDKLVFYGSVIACEPHAEETNCDRDFNHNSQQLENEVYLSEAPIINYSMEKDSHFSHNQDDITSAQLQSEKTEEFEMIDSNVLKEMEALAIIEHEDEDGKNVPNDKGLESKKSAEDIFLTEASIALFGSSDNPFKSIQEIEAFINQLKNFELEKAQTEEIRLEEDDFSVGEAMNEISSGSQQSASASSSDYASEEFDVYNNNNSDLSVHSLSSVSSSSFSSSIEIQFKNEEVPSEEGKIISDFCVLSDVSEENKTKSMLEDDSDGDSNPSRLKNDHSSAFEEVFDNSENLDSEISSGSLSSYHDCETGNVIHSFNAKKNIFVKDVENGLLGRYNESKGLLNHEHISVISEKNNTLFSVSTLAKGQDSLNHGESRPQTQTIEENRLESASIILPEASTFMFDRNSYLSSVVDSTPYQIENHFVTLETPPPPYFAQEDAIMATVIPDSTHGIFNKQCMASSSKLMATVEASSVGENNLDKNVDMIIKPGTSLDSSCLSTQNKQYALTSPLSHSTSSLLNPIRVEQHFPLLTDLEISHRPNPLNATQCLDIQDGSYSDADDKDPVYFNSDLETPTAILAVHNNHSLIPHGRLDVMSDRRASQIISSEVQPGEGTELLITSLSENNEAKSFDKDPTADNSQCTFDESIDDDTYFPQINSSSFEQKRIFNNHSRCGTSNSMINTQQVDTMYTTAEPNHVHQYKIGSKIVYPPSLPQSPPSPGFSSPDFSFPAPATNHCEPTSANHAPHYFPPSSPLFATPFTDQPRVTSLIKATSSNSPHAASLFAVSSPSHHREPCDPLISELSPLVSAGGHQNLQRSQSPSSRLQHRFDETFRSGQHPPLQQVNSSTTPALSSTQPGGTLSFLSPIGTGRESAHSPLDPAASSPGAARFMLPQSVPSPLRHFHNDANVRSTHSGAEEHILHPLQIVNFLWSKWSEEVDASNFRDHREARLRGAVPIAPSIANFLPPPMFWKEETQSLLSRETSFLALRFDAESPEFAREETLARVQIHNFIEVLKEEAWESCALEIFECVGPVVALQLLIPPANPTASLVSRLECMHQILTASYSSTHYTSLALPLEFWMTKFRDQVHAQFAHAIIECLSSAGALSSILAPSANFDSEMNILQIILQDIVDDLKRLPPLRPTSEKVSHHVAVGSQSPMMQKSTVLQEQSPQLKQSTKSPPTSATQMNHNSNSCYRRRNRCFEYPKEFLMRGQPRYTPLASHSQTRSCKSNKNAPPHFSSPSIVVKDRNQTMNKVQVFLESYNEAKKPPKDETQYKVLNRNINSPLTKDRVTVQAITKLNKFVNSNERISKLLSFSAWKKMKET